MALSVLAYNLTRVMNIVGTNPLMAAIATGGRTVRPSLRLPRNGFLHGQDQKHPSSKTDYFETKLCSRRKWPGPVSYWKRKAGQPAGRSISNRRC
jgi:hypothetical protein